MELLHASAFTSIVLATQQERLPPFAEMKRIEYRETPVPRLTRGRGPKIIAGLLMLLLLANAAVPAFAGRLHHQQQSAQRQERDIAAAKKKGSKFKTVTRTFTSTDPILIPEAAVGEDAFGAAEPYPSIIRVKGFENAKVTDVNLTLAGLTHDFSRDIDVMLVSPNGRNAVVMGDIGVNAGDIDILDLVLTLDDEASASLPSEETLEAPRSGTFRPRDNFGLDDADDPDEPALRAFLAPAPAASGRSTLSTFDGSNPNGQWRLFIIDDAASDDGRLSEGWTLEITAKSKTKQKRKKRH